MGKCQWQASPPPSPLPFPLTKRPELRSILTYQLINIYLRPHMVFKMGIVAIERDGRKKIVVVLASVSWSWKFHFHGCALQPFIKERHGLTLPWLEVVILDQMSRDSRKLCISQFQQCPSPPPPRANPRGLAFFLKNGQIPRGGDT